MNPGPTTSQRLRPFKPLRFGRYTLLMPLSTGGMGEIYLARLEGSHGFDKLCVIKKILPHLAQDPQFVERFVDEAHILVKLSHGSIAQVLDMGVHDGAPYIALEFVDGKDLRRVLQRMRDRKLPLPLSFVLSVVTRVLDALAYAHRKRDDQDHELNLVHRDVSPQNVLISYEGEVKVIDFGLAKSTQSASRTNPSIVLGKFMYMAPEQARHKAVDRRSDLYAVGLCLWELVTGKNPFEDVPPGEIMGKVANPTIPPLNTIEPLCPLALSEAVARALAVDPAQRYQTAEEFRGKLQTILQQIDPLAGAESTSRFMRDAFATEYQFERRMLTTVKEQARALAEAAAAEAAVAPASSEETLDNAPSPFAAGARPTPIATPAISLPTDELTPLAPRAALAAPLSFQPTRKTTSGVSKAHEEHEKETLPSIPLKTDLALATPPASPPRAAPSPASPAAPTPAAFLPTPMLAQPAAGGAPSPEKIRARVLLKSFDQEATEAATPAIAEPEPLPSIVIDGLPSEPVRTEQEVPSQEAPVPPPSPAARSTRPQAGKKPPKLARPPPEKPRASRDRLEKTGEKPMPRVARPPLPLRTDTQVLEPIAERAAAQAAPAPARSDRWLWFAVPLIAIAGLGALIAWDIHTDRQRAAQEEAVPSPSPSPSPVKPAPLPSPAPPRQKLTTPQLPPTPEPMKDDGAKRRPTTPTAPRPTRPASSPGATAFSLLQRDFDALDDEGVQRKFRLQLAALAEQLGDKGDDPAFVRKVEALHEQVKTALAKQQ